MSDYNPSPIQDAISAASGRGIRALVRNGWELLAVITGETANEDKAIEMLQEMGLLRDEPVHVLSEAKLSYGIPMAIMPCSHVSGLTARLIYGDAAESASLIRGRPELCVQGGVVHLRQFAVGPVELPLHSEGKVYRRTAEALGESEFVIHGQRYASR